MPASPTGAVICLDKLTTRLIRENQVVCVESLAVKHLLHNHHLAKAIADVGWGELLRLLSYKAAWYSRTVVAIDRCFPSSKRCSVCGYLLDELELDVRQWTCPACGTVHDRDTNAALNIKAEGRITCWPVEARVRPNQHGKGGEARSGEAGRSLSRGGESHHREVIGRMSINANPLSGKGAQVVDVE
jgi:putative transposase